MSRVNATGRADTKRKLRRMKIEGQFIAHKVDMIASPAYGVLSKSERRLLDRLELEHAKHGGMENGNLVCTYSDFNKFGIRLESIPAAIRVLCALGFVEVTKQGRAGVGEFRKPSRYRLTYLNTTGANAVDAEKPTDEWREIKIRALARLIAKTAREAKTKNKKPPRKTVVALPPEAEAIAAIAAPRNGSMGATTETEAPSIFTQVGAVSKPTDRTPSNPSGQGNALLAAYQTLAIWSALVIAKRIQI